MSRICKLRKILIKIFLPGFFSFRIFVYIYISNQKQNIMASQKDKDYHKLRHPEKYSLTAKNTGKKMYMGVIDGKEVILKDKSMTKEDAEADAAYRKLHLKFGGKSMVSDKRRRNSTRKSNQKVKAMSHQIDRAREKQQVIKIVQSPDDLAFVQPLSWAKQHGFYF